MQNKGVIRLFAILLAVVCAFQLSFTLRTYMIKKQAAEYAKGDPAKEFRYLDSISSEIVYNIGLAKYTFRECQERELNLGLDLKGGMNVILEVSVIDILKSLSGNSKDTSFVKAIALAQEMQKQGNEDFITLFGKAFEQVNPNGRLSVIFSTIELKNRVNFNSTNEEVLDVIKQETKGAIDNAFQILSTRIDKFGVAQPRIQRLETQGRILVELPGVKEQARVRKILQSTANLEFWETYNIRDIYDGLIQANVIIKNKLEVEKENLKSAATDVELNNNTPDTVKKVEDEGLELLSQIKEDTASVDTSAAANQLQESYPLFAVLQPSVNPQTGDVPRGSVIGSTRSRDTSAVNAYLELPAVKSLFPRDIKFLWSAFPIKNSETNKFTDIFELHAIKQTGRGDGNPPLSGDVITSARADFDENNAQSEVLMGMNAEGSKIWARITAENIGKSIAVVLDNYVYSSPVVETEIKGGNSRITGSFDVKEAQDLANMLKSGKLPAPARIIQDTVIGPSLGQESIDAGFNSFIIAFLIVLIYMVFYYSRNAGSVASFALITNMFFLFGVLASLGAALTLPGIAGIVLTMGMAVDANVLIYERIREEMRAGKGLKLAISDGYKNAYSAIIDGNVTTLLTGVILYVFGTGPIKGFATTLVIGILTSLFSAIFITRLIFIGMMDRNKELMFSTKLTENFLKNVNLDFMKGRKFFYIISGLIIAVGIGSLVTKGLNAGVDFTGGRTYVVRFDQAKVTTIEIQNLLKDEFEGAPEVVIFGGDNQVRIMTKYKINENDPVVDDMVEDKLFAGLQPLLGDISKQQFEDSHLMRSDKVGPTIADDIKIQAVWSVFFALIGIFIYILIRFRNWQFGLGGLLSLIHDALLVIGAFSIFYGILPFTLEVDQAFIAAILTVVGYSINDTVIVFDRIRENIFLHPKYSSRQVINMSINQTLARTMNTSMTTIFTILVIFIFGGEVIRGFAFALLVGVATGTYSSVFIASSALYDTLKREETGKHTLSGVRRS